MTKRVCGTLLTLVHFEAIQSQDLAVIWKGENNVARKGGANDALSSALLRLTQHTGNGNVCSQLMSDA